MPCKEALALIPEKDTPVKRLSLIELLMTIHQLMGATTLAATSKLQSM